MESTDVEKEKSIDAINLCLEDLDNGVDRSNLTYRDRHNRISKDDIKEFCEMHELENIRGKNKYETIYLIWTNMKEAGLR